MKVFVAGGTGVIGRHAVPALVAAGHSVTVIARSPDRDALVASMGARPSRTDLFDRDAVSAAVRGHDAVVNLASHIPPLHRAARMAAWEENDRIRAEGSANLAAAAREHGAQRFVQESITFPYLDGGEGWIDEESPRPSNEITASVDSAEDAALRFDDAGRVGVVLRFAQFYAPDAAHTKAFALSFRFRLNPLVGEPDAYISFIGMPAAARSVVAALDLPGGVYNVADADPPTRREAADTVASALGRRSPLNPPMSLVKRVNPSAEILARSQRVSTDKLRSSSDWAPDHSGADGLAAAVAAVDGSGR